MFNISGHRNMCRKLTALIIVILSLTSYFLGVILICARIANHLPSLLKSPNICIFLMNFPNALFYTCPEKRRKTKDIRKYISLLDAIILYVPIPKLQIRSWYCSYYKLKLAPFRPAKSFNFSRAVKIAHD